MRTFYILRDATRDALINEVCKMYNINYGVLVYSIVVFNPLEMAISILALKLGVNKLVISLIIAFLI
jgi:hypothetical protein